MKSLNFLLLVACLFCLVSCNEDPTPEAGLESSFFSQTCIKNPGKGCGVTWNIFFSRASFPDNVQVLLNDEIVIDDCDPQSYWSRTQTAKDVQFTLSDYANLAGTEKFSMRVFDRLDCNSDKKTEHSFVANQPYTIKTENSVKVIWIERN